MAEFVQLRKEKWTDALASLTQLELLENEEFRSIVKNLDSFEYKIQTPNRKLEDVLAYINYECDVLKLIQHRRKVLNQYELTDEIDRFIYNEIRAQFGSAEINFKHKIEFWNARLNFIAKIVPEQDRESEFNLIFKKALNFCGRSHFPLYKYVVDFQWTFLRIPVPTNSRKRKKLERRDCSKLITSIREVTREALRNFPTSSEATNLALTNELKYLCELKSERNLLEEDPKAYIPFDIQEEVDKTEKLILVLYSDFIQKQSQSKRSCLAYFQFHDEVSNYDSPIAKELSKKIMGEILGIHPKTPEIFAWLIEKSLEENRSDECLEKMAQALSSIPSRSMLEICLDHLDSILHSRNPETDFLAKILQFYIDLFSNRSWDSVPSVKYHASRINFVKNVPNYLNDLSDSSKYEALVGSLKSIVENDSVQTLTKRAVEKFPKSYVLARERIILLLTKDDFKPPVVHRYLSGVDWKSVDDEEQARKFINFIYYKYLTSGKENKVKSLFTLRGIPGIEEVCIAHLKKMYLEGVQGGRKFFQETRLLMTGWKFPYTTVEIETNICRASGKYSDVLTTAIEDACRQCKTTATEPWILCVCAHVRMKNEVKASELLQRALSYFSAQQADSKLHKELLMFSKSFKTMQCW